MKSFLNRKNFFVVLVLTAVVGLFAEATFAEPNLVSWWKFDEGSGTIAYDSAGSNHGFIYGATRKVGPIDGVLSFDGVDDYVDCGNDNSLAITNNLTIAAWVKRESAAGSTNEIIVSKYNGGKRSYRLFFIGNDRIRWWLSQDGGTTNRKYVSSTLQITDTNWHFIAATFKSGSLRIYIDGVNRTDSGKGNISSIFASTEPLFIGQENSGSYFNGLIDDVRICNRVLSAEEIQQLYLSGWGDVLGLEIIGPGRVRENCQVQYNAIAHYDNNNTIDVTNLANWLVEPNNIADVEFGLLQTEDINIPQDITIYVQYTVAGVSFEEEKMVVVTPPQVLYVPSDYQTIQQAIDVALCHDTVLVADGTYTGPGNRGIDLLGKAITVKSEDGPENCIIDCETLGRGFNIRSGESSNSILEGFTIKNGKSSTYGGGIYCSDSRPMIRNCILENNRALWGGGGMGVYNLSQPTMLNCVFRNNRVVGQGMNPGYGGGISTFYTNPTLINCIFVGNSAGNGGGMGNYNGSQPKLVNCLFFDNTASSDGGAIKNHNGYPELTNCTLVGNRASQGGGIQDFYSRSILRNCVLWANSDNAGTGQRSQIYKNSGVPVVSYCCIQGWTGSWGGVGNIGGDPLFVNLDSGNCHLRADSPCIDAGANNAVPGSVTTDLDGNPRFVDEPDIPDTGNGIPPIVDMGAYEFFNTYPVACIVGGDRAVEVGSDCEARVTLDGSCSSDADSTPGTNDDINDFDWYEVIDVCDPNSDIFLGNGEIIECNLPLGEHDIVLEVTDKACAFDVNEATITVEDTTPPMITLNGSAMVVLECGVDSYTEPGAMAMDNCDPNVAVIIGGDVVDSSTCGTYLVTYDATDESGNSAAQVTRTVIVQDTIPPEFSLSVTPDTLWPANHKMVEITPSWEVSDNCDEWPEVTLVSISSSEADDSKGDGHTKDDIKIGKDGTIYLRAERSGAGKGRIYTITYQAVDDSGNITLKTATVTVPHDHRLRDRLIRRLRGRARRTAK